MQVNGYIIAHGADLSGADLSRADLYGADLSGADLYGANLSGANLSGANLSRANLYGANLSGANLYGANLYGANHVVSFGPVGRYRRVGYVVAHRDAHMVQLGCFWGSLGEALTRIAAQYGENSSYASLVSAAAATLPVTTQAYPIETADVAP